VSWFDFTLGLLVGGYFIALGLGFRNLQPAAVRGNKLIALFGCVILLINIGITLAERKWVDVPLTPQEFVTQENQRFHPPIQIDAALRLETLTATADRVIYDFTLVAVTQEEYEKRMAEQQAYYKPACTMPKLSTLLRAGITVQVNYRALTDLNHPETQIILKPSDCGYNVLETVGGKE